MKNQDQNLDAKALLAALMNARRKDEGGVKHCSINTQAKAGVTPKEQEVLETFKGEIFDESSDIEKYSTLSFSDLKETLSNQGEELIGLINREYIGDIDVDGQEAVSFTDSFIVTTDQHGVTTLNVEGALICLGKNQVKSLVDILSKQV